MPNPSQVGSRSMRKLTPRINKAAAAKVPRNAVLQINNRPPENPPNNLGYDGPDDTLVEDDRRPPLQIPHGVLNLGHPAIIYAPIFQGIIPNPTPEETPIIHTDVAAGDFSYLFPSSAELALYNIFIPANSPHRQYIYRATLFSCMQFVITEEIAGDASPVSSQFSITFQTPTMDGALSPHGTPNIRMIAWKCSQPGAEDLLFDIETLLFQSVSRHHILIIMNTCARYDEAVSNMEKLRYSSCHIIPPIGEIGGAVWIFWNQVDLIVDEMTVDNSYGHLKFIHPENFMRKSNRLAKVANEAPAT